MVWDVLPISNDLEMQRIRLSLSLMLLVGICLFSPPAFAPEPVSALRAQLAPRGFAMASDGTSHILMAAGHEQVNGFIYPEILTVSKDGTAHSTVQIPINFSVGWFSYQAPTFIEPNAIALSPSGVLAVAGSLYSEIKGRDNSDQHDGFVHWFEIDSDGIPTPSLGERLTPSSPNLPKGAEIQYELTEILSASFDSQGRLLVAGVCLTEYHHGKIYDNLAEAFVARYTTNRQLDSTFGRNGIAYLPIPTPYSDFNIHAVTSTIDDPLIQVTATLEVAQGTNSLERPDEILPTTQYFLEYQLDSATGVTIGDGPVKRDLAQFEGDSVYFAAMADGRLATLASQAPMAFKIYKRQPGTEATPERVLENIQADRTLISGEVRAIMPTERDFPIPLAFFQDGIAAMGLVDNGLGNYVIFRFNTNGHNRGATIVPSLNLASPMIPASAPTWCALSLSGFGTTWGLTGQPRP